MLQSLVSHGKKLESYLFFGNKETRQLESRVKADKYNQEK